MTLARKKAPGHDEKAHSPVFIFLTSFSIADQLRLMHYSDKSGKLSI